MKDFKLWSDKVDEEKQDLEDFHEARAMRPDRMSAQDIFMLSFIDGLRKTKKLPIVTFSQNFSKRKVAKGAMGNKSRTQAYLGTRKGGDPFDKFSSGSSAKPVVKMLPVKNVLNIVSQVELAMKELDPAVGGGKNIQRANAILSKIKVDTPEGMFSFFDIDDSSFRTKGGMKGGQSEAHTDQALQCVTSACMANGIWPLAKNYKKISRFVRVGSFNVEEILKSRDDPRFRNKENNWVNGAVATHKALEKKFGSLKGFIFVNENDKLHERLYKKAYELLSAEDSSWKKNTMERWNPADIWVMSDLSVVSELESSKTISEMNSKMLKMYPKRLIPVSMKKPGTSATIKVRNNEEDQEGLNLWDFDTTPKSIMSSSWFMIQGGYEYVAKNGNGKLMVCSYSGHPSVFFLNEKTGSKSDGAIGGKTTEMVLKQSGVTIPPARQMWDTFSQGYLMGSSSKFWKDFARMYDKYDSESVSANALREQAYAVIDPASLVGPANPKNPVFCTYNNLIMMEAIAGLGSTRSIQNCLQNIYRYTSSMTALSSVHIVVGADNSATTAANNATRKGKVNPGVTSLSPSPERFAATQKEIQAVRDEYGDKPLDAEGLKRIKRIRQVGRNG